MGESRMIAAAGLVDFHCHLDLYPDFPTAVQEAENAGVFTLAVTTTPGVAPEPRVGTAHETCAGGAGTASAVGRRAGEWNSICGIVICPRLATLVKSVSTLARMFMRLLD